MFNFTVSFEVSILEELEVVLSSNLPDDAMAVQSVKLQLSNVEYADSKGPGKWYPLVVLETNASLGKKASSLLVDSYLEFPPGMSDEEKVQFSEKMKVLHSIMDAEMTVLSRQANSLRMHAPQFQVATQEVHILGDGSSKSADSLLCAEFPSGNMTPSKQGLLGSVSPKDDRSNLSGHVSPHSDSYDESTLNYVKLDFSAVSFEDSKMSLESISTCDDLNEQFMIGAAICTRNYSTLSDVLSCSTMQTEKKPSEKQDDASSLSSTISRKSLEEDRVGAEREKREKKEVFPLKMEILGRSLDGDKIRAERVKKEKKEVSSLKMESIERAVGLGCEEVKPAEEQGMMEKSSSLKSSQSQKSEGLVKQKAVDRQEIGVAKPQFSLDIHTSGLPPKPEVEKDKILKQFPTGTRPEPKLDTYPVKAAPPEADLSNDDTEGMRMIRKGMSMKISRGSILKRHEKRPPTAKVPPVRELSIQRSTEEMDDLYGEIANILGTGKTKTPRKSSIKQSSLSIDAPEDIYGAFANAMSAGEHGRPSKLKSKDSLDGKLGFQFETISFLSKTELKPQVCKRSLQALLYPLSHVKPHSFELVNFTHPVYCHECEALLWGVTKQGLKCSGCSIKVHQRCKDMIHPDCLYLMSQKKSSEKSSKKAKEQDDGGESIAKDMIISRMTEREKEVDSALVLLSKVFKVDIQNFINLVKKSVCSKKGAFSACVHLHVLEAKDLLVKDKSGTSNLYVTISIGNERCQTKVVRKNQNPVWDEKFDFEVGDSRERLKIRVWDEEKGLGAKLKHQVKNESDQFLGQVQLEMSSTFKEVESWFTLEKRTEKSQVSGQIKLRYSIEHLEDGKKMAPSLPQYFFLHEMMFKTIYQEDRNGVMMDQRSLVAGVFFYPDGQETISNFMSQFCIQPIFGLFVHFTCLTKHLTDTGVMEGILDLLREICKQLTLKTEKEMTPILEELTDSKSGSDVIVKTINGLRDVIEDWLGNFMSIFPAASALKLRELGNTVALLKEIVHLQSLLQILPIKTTRDGNPKAEAASICSRCIMRYCQSLFPKSTDKPRATELKAVVDYLSQLIDEVSSVISDITEVYSSVMKQFDDLLDPAQVSFSVCWDALLSELDHCLDEYKQEAGKYAHDVLFLFNQTKKVHLDFRSFSQENGLDTLEEVFNSFIIAWLTAAKLEMVTMNAVEKDSVSHFKPVSESNKFSSSVVDVSSILFTTASAVTELLAPFHVRHAPYYMLFAKLVDRNFRLYTSLIIDHLKQALSEKEREPSVFVLINNISECRLQLEGLFKKFFPPEMLEASQILTETQRFLGAAIDRSCEDYVSWFTGTLYDAFLKIDNQMEVFKFVSSLKEEDTKKEEIEPIINTSMQLLDVEVNTILEFCTNSITKKILLELWKYMLILFEQIILLPELDSEDSDLERNFNTKQTSLLNGIVDYWKDYLASMGAPVDVKLKHFNKHAQTKRVLNIISLHRESTDSLVKRFITTETDQCKDLDKSSVGKAYISMDCATFQTGEVRLTIKLKEAIFEKRGRDKIYFSFVLFGPHVTSFDWYNESSAKQGPNPNFDETIVFNFTSSESISSYELHIFAKSKTAPSTRDIIGMTVLQLARMSKHASLSMWFILGSSLSFTDAGLIILSLLNLRPKDKLATAFVSFKLSTAAGQEISD